MPTLQQLRYLVALAETRHFRRAAEATNVTQPTLSTQLRELEERLGVQLVERRRGGVILTRAGSEITRHARTMLRDLAEIRAIARRAATPLADTIKLGVLPSLGPYLMPLAVPDLHRSYPDLKLYIREEMPAALADQLEAGDLDVVVASLPLERADIETMPLFEEPLLLIVPLDHALAAEQAALLSDLRGETVLALQSEPRLYNQVRALADANGARLSHDYEGTSLDTLRQMVSMGMGLTLLPALYVKSEVTKRDILRACPIAGVPPTRLIGLAWRRGTASEGAYRAIGEAIRTALAEGAPEVTVPR